MLESLRASEATRGEEPEAFARDLSARLRFADGGLRSDDPLAIDFQAFRRWVENERRMRRLEIQTMKPRRLRLLEPWPQESIARNGKAAKKAAESTEPSSWFLGRWLARFRQAVLDRMQGPPADVTHPMWDRWLDG